MTQLYQVRHIGRERMSLLLRWAMHAQICNLWMPLCSPMRPFSMSRLYRPGKSCRSSAWLGMKSWLSQVILEYLRWCEIPTFLPYFPQIMNRRVESPQTLAFQSPPKLVASRKTHLISKALLLISFYNHLIYLTWHSTQDSSENQRPCDSLHQNKNSFKF